MLKNSIKYILDALKNLIDCSVKYNTPTFTESGYCFVHPKKSGRKMLKTLQSLYYIV